MDKYTILRPLLDPEVIIGGEVFLRLSGPQVLLGEVNNIEDHVANDTNEDDKDTCHNHSAFPMM